MKIALNSLHWPVTVLGYGKRVGIWFQGCNIGCKGCCSTDTWKADESHQVEMDPIFSWIDSLEATQIDGFTISGGEPFEQPEALMALLSGIRQRFGSSGDKDVLVYSGFRFSVLQKQHAQILELCDVVIAEPYVRTLQPGPLRGSQNQGLNILSNLGLERYANLSNWHERNQMQATFDGADISIIGIPSSSDLLELEGKLAEAGILIGKASWRV